MRFHPVIVAAFALCRCAGADTAEAILQQSAVQGGVVVVIGCDDPELLVGLRPNDAYLVQGLDTDVGKVRRARAAIRAEGAYGPVCVDVFDGNRLPYADDLVNLIVVRSGAFRGAGEELARVLCPGGVLLARDAHFFAAAALQARQAPRDGWRAAVKRIPHDIGAWPHYLCQANNNAVSQDSVVGPVGSLKWTCGPLWSRSHEFTSSVSILVAAGGRVFYVADEGPTSVTTPEILERWVLIARDAFNGKQLWRRPLPQWRSRLGPNTALRAVPPAAQRCLVADADRLYASPALGAPIEAVDAATGEILATYEATQGVREFVKVGESIVFYREQQHDRRRGRIARLDLDSGRLLWSAPNDRYTAESLAASEKYVIYHNGETVVCLDFADGDRRWPGRAPAKSQQGRAPRLGRATYIIHEDKVLEGGANFTVARRADSGKVLWRVRTGGKAMRGSDCFVARGCVWRASGDKIVGYDLDTGEAAHTIDPTSVESPGHHLRCYRAKATENYLITQFRGVEFVSLTGGRHSQTDWTRGACSFGVVPANGLLYVPPNPCFCYPGAKILGFNALARPQAAPTTGDRSRRLERGPAYVRLPPNGSAPTETRAPQAPSDWPTYRHDPMRHGAAACDIRANVAVGWRTDMNGRLSPPVAACGRVYVAAKDQHAVYALDAATGERVWWFTAGGRVDSPPTIYRPASVEPSRPLCLFGSADGYVYCVTANRGELVWRFRAAPSDRRIAAFDQLESVWPTHGSVLVKNDVAYFAAGRSTMLDGGVWLYGVDPATGQTLYETNVNTRSRLRNDASGQPFIPSYVMEGANADILVSEGDFLYMGPMMFDLKLRRRKTPYMMDPDHSVVAMDISREDYIIPNPELQQQGYEGYRGYHRYEEKVWPEMTERYKDRFGGFNLGDMKMGLHVTPTSGFLDESWFNRTCWMYSDKWPGWYHAHRGAKTGQLLVVGRRRTYALQSYPERNRQSPLFTPAHRGYLLLADANDNEPVLDWKTRGATKGLGYTRMRPPLWYDWIPIRVRAMVEAGDVLFAAGPPDVIPEDDPAAALEGRRGAVMRAISAAGGETLSELALDSPPVFDGLIAAANRLFMATKDGQVVCFLEQ